MRRLISFIFMLTAASQIWGQDQLFAVARNGKWGLVDHTGKEILKRSYDHIYYSAVADKFVYTINNKRGIVSGTGKILSQPVYTHITFHDSTWYSCKKDGAWNLIEHTTTHYPHIFQRITQLDAGLFALYTDTTCKLYDGPNKHELATRFKRLTVFESDFIVGELSDGTIDLLRKDKLTAVFNGTATPEKVAFNYAIMPANNSVQLIQLKEKKAIGTPADTLIYLFGNYFLGKRNDAPIILDGIRGNDYTAPDLDRVVNIDFPFLIFEKRLKQGVWNLVQQKLAVPPNFEGVQFFGDHFLITHHNQFGAVNQSGTTVVPVTYQSVAYYKTGFVVSDKSKYGFISRNGANIVPCSHTEIAVFGQNIKCYNSRAMTLIKLDESGRVSSKKNYTNYMRLSVEKADLPKQQSAEINFDNEQSSGQERYGWYQPLLERKIEDTILTYRGKWGLKDSLDSVAIRPQFSAIEIHKKSGITKAYFRSPIRSGGTSLKKKRVYPYALTPRSRGLYSINFLLVDHKARQLISKKKFAWVNLNDFTKYRLARAFETRLQLIDEDANVVWDSLNYYGDYDEDILRICTGGEPELTQDFSKNTVDLTGNFFNRTGAVQTRVHERELCYGVKNGQWFYLDAQGNKLNETPFQYANEFKHGLAIVKQNNKWGVIDTAMQIVIPFEYYDIDRLIHKGKSYFLVDQQKNGNYVYTKGTGQVTPTEIKKLEHYYQGNWFAQKQQGSTWGLVDTNLNPITSFGYSRVSPFEKGYAQVTLRGKKTLITPEGNEVFPFIKAKKIRPLGYDRFEIVSSKGDYVINSTGDTLLLPKSYRALKECTAQFLMYESRQKQLSGLYFQDDVNAQPLKLPKKTRLISYTLTEQLFLVEKKGKKHLFSLENGKYIRKKIENIIALGEGSMVYLDPKTRLYGYLSFDGDTLTPAEYKTLDPTCNGWAFAIKGKKRAIINKTGQPLFPFDVFRVIPNGEDFTIITKEGSGLINPKGKLIIPPQYTSITRYNDQFYKAKTGPFACDLYDLEGKKINNESYREIKAISNKTLIVNDFPYDYLYTGFLNKSLAFPSIHPISEKNYLLHERFLRGVFNDKGENIVPVKYHIIRLDRDHFSVSFFNSFGYYTTDGKVLSDPKQ